MIEPTALTPDAFAPYGWVLGKPINPKAEVAFTSAASDFWQEHVFDTGGGETEILWVAYRDTSPRIEKLEAHLVTEQAVVPLSGDIVQIVATGGLEGRIDKASLRAFVVPAGMGICMRPGCWHATRVAGGEEVRCLMLTRRSTTRDLLSLLRGSTSDPETIFANVALHFSCDKLK